MKKIIAIFLSLVIAATLTCSVLATDEYNAMETNIQVLTPDTFTSLFSASSINRLTYSYTFVPCDSNIADVEIDLTLTVGNTTYTGSASGTVCGNQVNAVDYIWEGSLDGIIRVHNDMIMNVGFSKHNGTNAVQICCTIQPIDVEAGDIIAFAAGSITLQREISLENLKKFIDSGIEEGNNMLGLGDDIGVLSIGGGDIVQEPGDDLGGSTYTYKGSRSVGFRQDKYSGTGCRTIAYFASALNSVAVCSVPYVENINNYYRNFPTATSVSTEIASIEYNLTCESSEPGNKCNILGIDKPGYTNQWNAELSPLFEDIMGILGVPTSTISAILAELSGGVRIIESFNSCHTAKVSFALGTSGDLAAAEQPIPIVFNLQKASDANYVGGTELVASTTIKYRTAVMFESQYAWPWLFTTTTHTAGVDFEVTLT